MSVRTGILLLGAEPIGEGVNSAVRGFADLGGVELPVVAKCLPPHEVLAEVYCSLLCHRVGLPVPEPLILQDQATSQLMFGSVDFPHPNCSQFLKLDNTDPSAGIRWGRLLSKWSALPSVIAFDEWINNRDRNPGNILWQDEDQFALIDHGKALGIDAAYPDVNKLVVFWLLSVAGDELSQKRVRKAALNFALAFKDVQAYECEQEIINLDGQLAVEFRDFVCNRLLRLSELIDRRFPGSQMTLNL